MPGLSLRYRPGESDRLRQHTAWRHPDQVSLRTNLFADVPAIG
jgi:hypothetical protein